jgi:hypothetical protein
MSTASVGARAQRAVQLRILHSLDRSRRRQRNPGDQDRSRAGQRADVPRAKIAATITFAHEMAAARAKDAYADQALRRFATAGAFLIYDD